MEKEGRKKLEGGGVAELGVGMGEESQTQKEKVVVALVEELVQRLLCNNHHHLSSSTASLDTYFRYALRILSSSIAPSLLSDSSLLAQSIKRDLVSHGRSSLALTFSDLYTNFSSLSTLTNKSAILYLLHSISLRQTPSSSSPSTPFSFLPSSSSPWPSAPLSSHSISPPLKSRVSERGQNAALISIAKNTHKNQRSSAYSSFAEVVKEESEVGEDVLVREVLYACQGIDGNYLKFDKDADAYVISEEVRVFRGSRMMLMMLCELGWLFRKVNGYISESMQQPRFGDLGTVGQAFCAALHDDLSLYYYKLLAILEAHAVNPIPLVSETPLCVGGSGDYLSLRRLAVWLAEPMVRMRLMAVLVDKCGLMRGGAMAGSIHMYSRHGDPLVQGFMKGLLSRVCTPLFKMVRRWVLEGELEDLSSEFFIISQHVRPECLWRDGYILDSTMLPCFILPPLADCIFRTGKSINFLRVCCEDREWAEMADAAAAEAKGGGLEYGETDAVEALVGEAAKRIDGHLLEVMYSRYKLKEHCLAIKRYLLLGQGDFVQHLMDIVGVELSQPANRVSLFNLSGLLESAIRGSNAQYDEAATLERVKVKMMGDGGDGDQGWDVFSLDYETGLPLSTVFTEMLMSKYLRVFNFLWRLRRVEHALIGGWKTMKPNSSALHFVSKLEKGVRMEVMVSSRQCQVLWGEMNHFVTNLQYYIMFEVLEVSWSELVLQMEGAEDLDEVLSAHDKYLHSVVDKSLLGKESAVLHVSLLALFDLVLRFRSQADKLYEGIHEWKIRSERKGGWEGEKKEVTERGVEFVRKMRGEVTATAKEYSSVLHKFISQLPLQSHIDLKFLLFRLHFTHFYSK